MILRIVGKHNGHHFVGGVVFDDSGYIQDLESGRPNMAPILRQYIHPDWMIEKVTEFCHSKGWFCQRLQEALGDD